MKFDDWLDPEPDPPPKASLPTARWWEIALALVAGYLAGIISFAVLLHRSSPL